MIASVLQRNAQCRSIFVRFDIGGVRARYGLTLAERQIDELGVGYKVSGVGRYVLLRGLGAFLLPLINDIVLAQHSRMSYDTFGIRSKSLRQRI